MTLRNLFNNPFGRKERALSPQSELNLLTAGLIPGTSHYVGINGVPVNALRNSTVYRCVKILAETLSTLSLRLIDRTTKDDVLNHPVFRLFETPNDDQTMVEFLEMMLVHYFVFGNSYVEKEITRGQVSSLWPMNPALTTVQRDQSGSYFNFAAAGKSSRIEGANVMHFRMFGASDICGMSPVWAAEKAICLSSTQEQMVLEHFTSGIAPDMVVHLPPEKVLGGVNKANNESIKQEKISIQQAIESARTRRALYLPYGFEATPYASNYQQAQVQESRDFQVLEIARIFGVPPSKLGVSSSKSANQTEGERLAFFQDTLRPVIVKLEKRLERDLLSASDRAKYSIRFNVKSLLRADPATQTDQYVKLWQIGAYTTNNILDMEDLPRSTDPKADQHQYPVNMTTENINGASQPTNPADGGVPARSGGQIPQKRTATAINPVRQRSLDRRTTASRMARPLFHAAVSKIVRKEKSVVMKDARSILSSRSAENLEDRLRELYSGELQQFIKEHVQEPVETLFREIVDAMEAELGTTFNTTELRNMVEKYVEIYVREYTDSSTGQLIEVIRKSETSADILKNVEQRLDEWDKGTSEDTPSRAEKESFNEPNRGAAVFGKCLYALGGIKSLRWVCNTPCDFCDPLDGQTFSPDNFPDQPLHSFCVCSMTEA